MRRMLQPGLAAVLLVIGVAPAVEAQPAPGAGALPSLDRLVEEFGIATPQAGKVNLDAWVEGKGAAREVVIVLQPEGKAKLMADPGITVTPEERVGVAWRSALPHRHVDGSRDYFDPPATVRLPFTATDDQPIRILVEFAYCFVDYQCFFGEETLSVANRID